MNKAVTIVDYGVGNLFSLSSSLKVLGIDVQISGKAQDLQNASKIILPGVGAFEDAAEKLRAAGLSDVLKEEAKKGKPLLGICLGMQLLFDESHEFGCHAGLGLIPGTVCSLEEDLQKAGYGYKVPQIGWNPVHLHKERSPLLKYTKEGDAFYFVHSFYAKTRTEYLVASCEYGIEVTAAVQQDNVYGTQFHPEKSGPVGLSMLKAFSEVE